MDIRLYQVDSFTSKPFSGNPAGVCLLAEEKPASWMHSVAAEMNLAETAFLVPQADGYHLRWFTPQVEVALCGHATLASAHILWETGALSGSQSARFHTLSGLLTCSKREDGIQMDFPATPAVPTPPLPEMDAALGAKVLFIGKNNYDYLVEVADETIVRGMQPNMSQLTGMTTRGVIVTSRSSQPDFDFICRFFAPAVGIPEDPVTGSAFCTLGPFWKERLHKAEMSVYQASRRGGTARITVGDRILITGKAVTVFQIQFSPAFSL